MVDLVCGVGGRFLSLHRLTRLKGIRDGGVIHQMALRANLERLQLQSHNVPPALIAYAG